MNSKKLLKMGLAYLTALSIMTGCGTAVSTESPENTKSPESGESSHDTLVFGLESNPTNLAPNDSMAAACRTVVSNIYGRLWYYEGDEIVYRCATSAEYVDDTHIKIILRDDVYDSEGNHMTAEDIIFDFQNLEGRVYASFVEYVDFENTKIEDDYTLVLALTQPYNLQIKKMSGIDLYDKDAFNASKDGMVTNPVGYGPYKLESYVSGSEVVLALRDDYFEGTGQFKTVNCKVISESSQRTNALISGDLDATNFVLESDIEYINETDGLIVKEYPYLNCTGMIFNCSEASVCSDVNIRKAVAYAIDAADIVNIGYHGYADHATDICSTACSSDADNWVDIAKEFDNYYQQDIEKAKQLLVEAGYENGLTLQAYHYGRGSGGDAAAELVQAMLAEVGIKMEITQLDQATLEAVLKSQQDTWDIYFNGWMADSDVSYDLIGLQVLKLDLALYSGENRERLVSLVEQAERSSDEKEVAELTKEIHRITSGDLPYYTLADVRGEYAVKEGINPNFWSEPMVTIDFFTTTWE